MENSAYSDVHISENFFKEPLISEQQQAVMQKIADIYKVHGTVHPLLVPPETNLQGKGNLLSTRIPKMQQIRQNILDYAQTQEGGGSDGDFALHAQIGLMIGPTLDQILLSQFNDPDRTNKSWMEIDELNTQKLQQKVQSLLDEQTGRYQIFLDRYPDFRAALRLLTGDILTEKNPKKLDELVKNFEMCAIRETQSGMSFVTLLGMSESWTLESDSGQLPHYRLLEPNLRIIMLLEPKRKLQLEDLYQNLYKLVANYYQSPKTDDGETSAPALVAEIAVVSAGTEVLSQSVGEAFDSNGLVFLINQIKNRASLEKVYEEIEHRGKFPDYSLHLLSIILLAHEAGHKSRQVKVAGLEELVPDMTTLLAGIDYIKASGPKEMQEELLENFILHSLGEFIFQTQDNDAEYRRSSYYILNTLMEQGVLVYTDPHYALDLSKLDSFHLKVQKDHAALLREDDLAENTPRTLAEQFLRLKLGDQIKPLVDRVMRGIELK